jgi:predicted lysophospholipase L1 biosynthesis ABC-type transport system permease subunit
LNPNVSPSVALQKIDHVLGEVVPSALFDFRFIDDEYNAKFKSEERIGSLATVFTFLAALISGLGLVGLAAFSAEARSKEIGIRKVVGASTLSLCKLMTNDFMKLIVVACVIAMPIAYYLMDRWLHQFDYKISISLWTLALIAASAVGFTLLTVSYHSVQMALANPVKSLRSE